MLYLSSDVNWKFRLPILLDAELLDSSENCWRSSVSMNPREEDCLDNSMLFCNTERWINHTTTIAIDRKKITAASMWCSFGWQPITVCPWWKSTDHSYLHWPFHFRNTKKWNPTESSKLDSFHEKLPPRECIMVEDSAFLSSIIQPWGEDTNGGSWELEWWGSLFSRRREISCKSRCPPRILTIRIDCYHCRQQQTQHFHPRKI